MASGRRSDDDDDAAHAFPEAVVVVAGPRRAVQPAARAAGVDEMEIMVDGDAMGVSAARMGGFATSFEAGGRTAESTARLFAR